MWLFANQRRWQIPKRINVKVSAQNGSSKYEQKNDDDWRYVKKIKDKKIKVWKIFKMEISNVGGLTEGVYARKSVFSWFSYERVWMLCLLDLCFSDMVSPHICESQVFSSVLPNYFEISFSGKSMQICHFNMKFMSWYFDSKMCHQKDCMKTKTGREPLFLSNGFLSQS
jgi:hypothetical protein